MSGCLLMVLRRVEKRKTGRAPASANGGSVKRIVILGGGFAAIATAHRLEQRLRPDEAELVLISRENFSLFTPMLPEVSSGALDARNIVTPIRGRYGTGAECAHRDIQAHADRHHRDNVLR
jgi:NADPH-dependent 2,4-dienoyl-CoA reductase/sulfur reductase-like enzyme